MFNENSGLVKVWVELVSGGTFTREQVPSLSNLREMVYKVLDGMLEADTSTEQPETPSANVTPETGADSDTNGLLDMEETF